MFNSNPSSAPGLRFPSRKVHTAHCTSSLVADSPGFFYHLLIIDLSSAGHEVLPAPLQGQQGRNEENFNPVKALQVTFDHQTNMNNVSSYYFCLSRACTAHPQKAGHAGCYQLHQSHPCLEGTTTLSLLSWQTPECQNFLSNFLWINQMHPSAVHSQTTHSTKKMLCHHQNQQS